MVRELEQEVVSREVVALEGDGAARQLQQAGKIEGAGGHALEGAALPDVPDLEALTVEIEGRVLVVPEIDPLEVVAGRCALVEDGHPTLAIEEEHGSHHESKGCQAAPL